MENYKKKSMVLAIVQLCFCIIFTVLTMIPFGMDDDEGVIACLIILVKSGGEGLLGGIPAILYAVFLILTYIFNILLLVYTVKSKEANPRQLSKKLKMTGLILPFLCYVVHTLLFGAYITSFPYIVFGLLIVKVIFSSIMKKSLGLKRKVEKKGSDN